MDKILWLTNPIVRQFKKEGEKIMFNKFFKRAEEKKNTEVNVEETITRCFYEETRARNKEKFIAYATKKIEAQQKKLGGVHLPSFVEAENAYEEFKNAGCFDEYGRLKPLPQV